MVAQALVILPSPAQFHRHHLARPMSRRRHGSSTHRHSTWRWMHTGTWKGSWCQGWSQCSEFRYHGKSFCLGALFLSSQFWWINQWGKSTPTQQIQEPLIFETETFIYSGFSYIMDFPTFTSSTAQGGGGSFKNGKPIGEVSWCDAKMAERTHWWIERWLSVSPFLSLFLSCSLCLSFAIYLQSYLSSHLPIYLSIHVSIDRFVYSPIY